MRSVGRKTGHIADTESFQTGLINEDATHTGSINSYHFTGHENVYIRINRATVVSYFKTQHYNSMGLLKFREMLLSCGHKM